MPSFYCSPTHLEVPRGVDPQVAEIIRPTEILGILPISEAALRSHFQTKAPKRFTKAPLQEKQALDSYKEIMRRAVSMLLPPRMRSMSFSKSSGYSSMMALSLSSLASWSSARKDFIERAESCAKASRVDSRLLASCFKMAFYIFEEHFTCQYIHYIKYIYIYNIYSFMTVSHSSCIYTWIYIYIYHLISHHIPLDP